MSCHGIFKAKIRVQFKYLATTRKELKMQKQKIQMDIEKLRTKCSEENLSDQLIKQNLEKMTILENILQIAKNIESEKFFGKSKNSAEKLTMETQKSLNASQKPQP